MVGSMVQPYRFLCFLLKIYKSKSSCFGAWEKFFFLLSKWYVNLITKKWDWDRRREGRGNAAVITFLYASIILFLDYINSLWTLYIELRNNSKIIWKINNLEEYHKPGLIHYGLQLAECSDQLDQVLIKSYCWPYLPKSSTLPLLACRTCM